jgi:hypothetical protein
MPSLHGQPPRFQPRTHCAFVRQLLSKLFAGGVVRGLSTALFAPPGLRQVEAQARASIRR